MIGALKNVGIYVADQGEAVDFYAERFGFRVRCRMPMGPHAEWSNVSPPNGEEALMLYPKSMMPDWTEKKPSNVFHCSDVESTFRELALRGVDIKTQPTPMPRGTFASFVDRDGN